MPPTPEQHPQPEYSYGAFAEAVEEFSELPVVHEHDFDDRLRAAHHDLLGDVEPERAAATLERIKRKYTNNEGTFTNFRKAALDALEMLEDASYLQPAEIADFLDNHATEEEITAIRERRPAEKERILAGLQRAITSRHEKYGLGYRGMQAVVVYGSLANGTFIPGSSDIDMAVITESGDRGMEHDGRWVDYESDAHRALAAHTNRPVDDLISVPLSDAPRVRRLTSSEEAGPYEHPVIVVGISETIEGQVNGLLNEGRADASRMRAERELGGAGTTSALGGAGISGATGEPFPGSNS